MAAKQANRSSKWPSGFTPGFTLIEVLVALFVISIGLMGVAALFVQMFKFNGSAMYRVRAVMHAADMADRIRANPTAGNNFAVAAGASGTHATCHATNGSPNPTACSVANLAADEIFHWKQNLTSATSGLPVGTGAIVYTAAAGTNPASYIITITWQDVHDPGATESHNLRVEI